MAASSSFSTGNDSSIWIFAYGSLIWRPGFNSAECRLASVDGWSRRFWQASTDHRGTPDAPGRVVTLVPDTHGSCRGLAYRLPADTASAILSALDHREKDGYERVALSASLGPTAAGANSTPLLGNTIKIGAEKDSNDTSAFCVEVTTWIARDGNPSWLGAAPLDQMADQIASARGPSGRNLDYLLELGRAFELHGIVDGHVVELIESAG